MSLTLKIIREILLWASRAALPVSFTLPMFGQALLVGVLLVPVVGSLRDMRDLAGAARNGK